MPSSRGRLIAGLLGIAAIAVAASVLYQLWSVPARPEWNVLLITIDTTRADRLGCYGYGRAQTPAIDQLSREGVRYARCYAPAPLTLPSHCSLLTGLTPIRHGVHVNGETISSSVLTLPEVLKKQGFATGAVLGAFVLDSQFGLDQGYDFYDDDLSQGQELGRFHFAERNAELVTNAALGWWEQEHATSKFLWVHYFDPHAPYEAPGFDPTFTHLSDYDAEIAYVDRHLQMLLSVVDASDRDTLVVLASDHGEGLGEHGEETHGLFTYEPTLRVPLIVRFPDRREAGTEIRVPVSLVDVMPSILYWLGLSAVGGLDGQPLPLANRTSPRTATEQHPIYFENQFVARTYGWSPLEGIVVGQWKYIRAPRPELYDLSNDLREDTNLYAVGDVRSEQLAAQLDELVAGLMEHQAATSSVGELDEASMRKLESLGYVGTSSGIPGDAEAESAVAAADPKDMVAVYRQIHIAMRHIDHGRITEAVSLLVPIIDDSDQQPANPRAVRLLAMIVAEEPAARDEGIACLERLVQRSDDFSDWAFVLHALGAALVAETRFDEAVEPLRRLLERDPADADASCQLGHVYRELGSAAEAIDAYRRAVKLVEGVVPPPDWLPEARRQLALLRQSADGKATE